MGHALGRRTAAVLIAAVVAAACGDRAEPPPAPTGPLRLSSPVKGALDFAVIGDFGTGERPALEVAAALREWAADHPLDALVTTGDNVYQSGSPGEFAEAWHRPYGWVDDAGIPVVASLGNHDIRTDGGRPQLRLFDLPARWYAHRLGPVEFLVLDANVPAWEPQLHFAASALRRSTAPWQVAVFHQPAYSCSDHGSTPAIQQRWVPLLQAGGVDLVLSGHDHNYQRFGVRDIVFVVSGGAGQTLDRVGDCPAGTPAPAASLDDRHHFLYVRATEERLMIQAIPVPGLSPVDRFVVGG